MAKALCILLSLAALGASCCVYRDYGMGPETLHARFVGPDPTPYTATLEWEGERSPVPVADGAYTVAIPSTRWGDKVCFGIRVSGGPPPDRRGWVLFEQDGNLIKKLSVYELRKCDRDAAGRHMIE